MVQLTLTEAAATPCQLVIIIGLDELDPGTSTSDVRVSNSAKDVVGSCGGKWWGIMPEYLPEMAKAAVEAYLYAEGVPDVVSAVKSVRDSARRAQLRRAMQLDS